MGFRVSLAPSTVARGASRRDRSALNHSTGTRILSVDKALAGLLIVLTHLAQPAKVGDHACRKRVMCRVPELKVLACLSNDVRQRGIVDVADARKQMMLNLEIQAPQEPG